LPTKLSALGCSAADNDKEKIDKPINWLIFETDK
jgi:hypothetical protein